jgi:hypothetical protein
MPVTRYGSSRSCCRPDILHRARALLSVILISCTWRYFVKHSRISAKTREPVLGTCSGPLLCSLTPHPDNLDVLLELHANTVRWTLQHLHSIAVVSASGGSVQLIHPSFHNFLVDASRCDDDNVVVNAQDHHTLLPMSSAITTSPTYQTSHIPAHVQYACRHRGSHLLSSKVDDSVLGLLLRFLLESIA